MKATSIRATNSSTMAGHSRQTTTQLRVRYADTDAQGVVYHGAFFVFFEVARFELLLRLLGNDVAAATLWERLTIASARCDYKCPARYPEVITVQTYIQKVGRSSFAIRYEISNQGGECLATGSTVQVVLGSDNRPKAISQGLRQQLKPRVERRAVSQRKTIAYARESTPQITDQNRRRSRPAGVVEVSS